ncbi:MAG: hypothetical protein CMJ18_16135, partial [Phycisphaeraceae bacterium]|nr:hypothetical protein [Phycisphaeraceae bacterium]
MSDRPQETFDALTMPLDGAHSIAASAGTGKTFTIATLYLRYLLEWSCPVEQILVTTYTEAATAELKERLRARLHEAYRTICHPDAAASGHRDDDTVPRLLAIAGAASSAERLRDRLEAALLDYDRAPIYTIHGFCHRVLRDLVFETASRFDPELITTQVPMVDDAVFDFAARHWAEDDAVLARALPLRDHLEAMRKVATLATEHPGYPIVPAADVTALTAAPDGAADEALSSLRDAWQADGEEACALLYESFEKGHLSKTQYGHTRERIDETVAFIDDLVRSMSLNRFDPGSPASQRRLAQDVIIGGTLKKHQNDAARHPVFLAVQRVVEAVGRMHAGYEKRRIRMLAALGTDVRRRVRQVKEERGQVSFGDLLHQVDDALGGPGRATLIDVLRGRYRVALVDEFQDTDPVQYRIFRRAFHDAARDAATPRAFIMIGDPKQSIYRFRGADIHSYLHATDRRTTPHQHTMDRNWRSDGSLVDAVQAVFRTQDDPFRDRGIPLPKVHSENPDRFAGDPALEVVFVDRDARFGQGRAPGQDRVMGRIANVVAADIVQRLNGDHAYGEAIQPADFAVLCRTGNQLRRMQRALADRRVPVVLHSDESVYDTTEAQDMLRVLAALIDPNGAG